MFDSLKKKIIAKLKKNLGLEPESTESLRARGVTIGKNFSNYGTIDSGHGYLVTIGDDVILSTGTILAHDASTNIWLGRPKIGRVTIGSRVFIGAGAIILPNVTIGDDVIIGAGCVVAKNVPSDSVVVGNPMKIIGSTKEYIAKNKALMETSFVGDKYWKDMSKEDIKKVQDAIKDGEWGFDL